MAGNMLKSPHCVDDVLRCMQPLGPLMAGNGPDTEVILVVTDPNVFSRIMDELHSRESLRISKDTDVSMHLTVTKKSGQLSLGQLPAAGRALVDRVLHLVSLHIPSGPVVHVDESFGNARIGAVICAAAHVRGNVKLEYLFAETVTLLMGSVALPRTKLGGAEESSTVALGVLGGLTDMGCLPAHATLRGAPALALVGRFVRLRGLAKRADLNGTRGRVIRYNASSGRCDVRLANARGEVPMLITPQELVGGTAIMAVKPDNLREEGADEEEYDDPDVVLASRVAASAISDQETSRPGEPPATARLCRICLDGAKLPEHPLLQPCACRGTLAWAHNACLAQWRRTSTKEEAAVQCGECGDYYRDTLSITLLQERMETQHTSNDISYFKTSAYFADELQRQGKHEEEEQVRRQALNGYRALLGKHENTYDQLTRLATCLRLRQKRTEAERTAREAIQGLRVVVGDDHELTRSAKGVLGQILKEMGRTGNEVVQAARDLLEKNRMMSGTQDVTTISSMMNLGMLLASKDVCQVDEAELLFREALQTLRVTCGSRHPATQTVMNNLGKLLQVKGAFDDAKELLAEALQGRRSSLGNQHHETISSMGNLGFLLKLQGRVAEALPLLREYEMARQLAGNGDLECHGMSNAADDIKELEADLAAGTRVKPMDHTLKVIAKGVTVQIHSLSARPELNGCFAVLLDGLQQNGRVPLQVKGTSEHAGKHFSLKPANLRGQLGMY